MCRTRRRYFDQNIMAHWLSIPVVNFSETSCQHEPASQSCNCLASRLSRPAAGIMPPWSFGRRCRFARSHTLEARAHWCSSRRGCLPTEPMARSHRSEAGNLLTRVACGYRPGLGPRLMSVDLYLPFLVSWLGMVQSTHLISPRG